MPGHFPTLPNLPDTTASLPHAVTRHIQSEFDTLKLPAHRPVGGINERLDLSSFGSGLYFVSLKVGDERFEQKLVVSAAR